MIKTVHLVIDEYGLDTLQGEIEFASQDAGRATT
jgi:hypothetical protein